jgi:hypothetical protein
MQTFINFHLLDKSSRMDKMGKESTQCIENVGKGTRDSKRFILVRLVLV